MLVIAYMEPCPLVSTAEPLAASCEGFIHSSADAGHSGAVIRSAFSMTAKVSSDSAEVETRMVSPA